MIAAAKFEHAAAAISTKSRATKLGKPDLFLLERTEPMSIATKFRIITTAVFAASLSLAPLAAHADDHHYYGGDRGDYRGGDGGGYRGGDRGGDAIGGALLGIGIGALIGGAVVSQQQQYYAPPPPVYYAPPPPVYYAPPPGVYYSPY
ncbi:MAG: hypothetical protein POG24_01480 [Acidocella sp.]|nr:hypothetical protein [Acidocella sp.]